MKVEGNTVRLNFDTWRRADHRRSSVSPAQHKSRADRQAARLHHRGRGQEFRPAEAKIDGASVIVSSPEVPKPVAVRYAWITPKAWGVPYTFDFNLYNKDGLPAPLFRTDDWPARWQ